jgi:hypothetical protein
MKCPSLSRPATDHIQAKSSALKVRSDGKPGWNQRQSTESSAEKRAQSVLTWTPRIPRVVIMTLIPMKLMGVLHNLQNAMIQKFEHWMQPQSTELMSLIMLRIQFFSIENVVRVRWTKVMPSTKNMTIQQVPQYYESETTDFLTPKTQRSTFVRVFIQKKLMRVKCTLKKPGESRRATVFGIATD